MGIQGFNSNDYNSLSRDEKRIYNKTTSSFHSSKMDAVRRSREEEDEDGTLVIEVDHHLAITQALESRIKELEEQLAVYEQKEREADEAKQRQLEDEWFNKQLEEKKKLWFSTKPNTAKKSEVTVVEDPKKDAEVLYSMGKLFNNNFF